MDSWTRIAALVGLKRSSPSFYFNVWERRFFWQNHLEISLHCTLPNVHTSKRHIPSSKVLTSATPYTPCTITISGSNTSNSPTTLIAFSHLGGLVFQTGVTNKVVILQTGTFTSFWTGTDSDVVGAEDNNNGNSNTTAITGNTACSNDKPNCAAQRCRDVTVGGEWYLPAINEMTAFRNVLCPNIPPFPCNFGGFIPQLYYSSTEIDIDEATAMVFSDGTTGSFGKNVPGHHLEVRCVRTF